MMRSTPALRVTVDAGQLTQAPTNWTVTTPVSSSRPRRKMSPPSAWMAGRIASIVFWTCSSISAVSQSVGPVRNRAHDSTRPFAVVFPALGFLCDLRSPGRMGRDPDGRGPRGPLRGAAMDGQQAGRRRGQPTRGRRGQPSRLGPLDVRAQRLELLDEPVVPAV